MTTGDPKGLTISGGLLVCDLTGMAVASIGATRMENMLPSQYRLGHKSSGEIVLQGYFTWTEGWRTDGEWRDISTVELPA